MLNKRNYLSNAPLLTSEELLIPGAFFFAVALTISLFFLVLSFAIPDENDGGLKVIFVYEAVLWVDFFEELKLITFGIVNGDVEALWRSVYSQDSGQVDHRGSQIDFFLDELRLLSLLFFENKGFDCGFGIS